MSNKREDYISWGEYFMSMAKLSAKRSKDPNTQVGCCIIQPMNHKIISLGYNGLPYGCSDDEFPWGKESEKESENKYNYVVHAELNAILNANQNLDGSDIYVTLSPCCECMKAIIQSGIKKVYYIKKYKEDSEGYKSMEKMANAAKIELIQFDAPLSI